MTLGFAPFVRRFELKKTGSKDVFTTVSNGTAPPAGKTFFGVFDSGDPNTTISDGEVLLVAPLQDGTGRLSGSEAKIGTYMGVAYIDDEPGYDGLVVRIDGKPVLFTARRSPPRR